MAGPKKKYFGEVNLDNIGKAVKEHPHKMKDAGYGKELKVEAALWDDGSISIEVYENGTRYKVGRLMPSKFQPGSENNSFNNYKESSDLPF